MKMLWLYEYSPFLVVGTLAMLAIFMDDILVMRERRLKRENEG